MDSACACLMRLASAVHQQGYKVVLTGEGRRGLGRLCLFKTEKIRHMLLRNSDRRSVGDSHHGSGHDGGDRAHLPRGSRCRACAPPARHL